MPTILLLNGPNLNLLGAREPAVYGSTTLSDITQSLKSRTEHHNLQFDAYQSNSEGGLVDRIHQATSQDVAFIIMNPAAYTHTSIAIRDALLGVEIPFIEVHLSNVYKREDFRKQSYFSDIAVGVISGLGIDSYELALTAAINIVQANTPSN